MFFTLTSDQPSILHIVLEDSREFAHLILWKFENLENASDLIHLLSVEENKVCCCQVMFFYWFYERSLQLSVKQLDEI